MSVSSVQPALSATGSSLDFSYGAPSRLSVVDPGIDDPVSDTGLGPLRGDLQLSDEFACLLSIICEGSGEFQ